MDLLLYVAILAVIGFSRVGKTSNISDDVGITGVDAVVETCDLPIGNNLALHREIGAYTFILREVGLM